MPGRQGGFSIALEQDVLAPKDRIEGVVSCRKRGSSDVVIVRWIDGFGRVVHEAQKRLRGDSVSFGFSAAPALCIGNHMQVVLPNGEVAAEAEFVVTPDAEPWDDYQVIMYYAYEPHQQSRLRELGITGGMVQRPRRLLDKKATYTREWWGAGFRSYCEQILSDVYAEYHRDHPGEFPKHIRQLQVKDLYVKDRSKLDALIRNPCFHDPKVKRKIEKTLKDVVDANRRYAPIFYSLADEIGVGDLVTAWDFCFDIRTLRAMRKWLREMYGSLKDLNAAWDTQFKSWSAVRPLTTDEMMARGDDNLSPWADHRTFMEKTLSEAVRLGTDAVLTEDPNAYVGIVGGQMPSAFGGYDYWRLAHAINAIEPYNIGNNREIWRSFNPSAVAVTTTFGFSDQEVWRLWYQLLHGDRGVIIYDEKNRYLTKKGDPTRLGHRVGNVYRELTGGVCKLLSASTRTDQPVTIHYSQASIHAHWMFEARPEGQNWLKRGSAAERLRSDFLRLRESFVKLLEDQQVQYTFTAYEQLERGHLRTSGDRLLLLPQSIAMSEEEVAAVRRFVEKGGVAVADSRLALMDEHCRRLEAGQLDDLFGICRGDQVWKSGKPGVKRTEGKIDGLNAPDENLTLCTVEPSVTVRSDSGAVALYIDEHGVPAVIVNRVGRGYAVYLNLDVTDYHRWRLNPPEDEDCRVLFAALTNWVGIEPEYRVAGPDGDFVSAVEVHPFENGAMRIVGIHRNPQLRVDELGPPQYRSNKAFRKPVPMSVDLGARYAVYDVREGKSLGVRRRVNLTLDPWQPTILALLPKAVRGIRLELPEQVQRGKAVRYRIALDAVAPGAVHAYRVELVGPDGDLLPIYSRNIAGRKGKASGVFHLAQSDPIGEYALIVRDVATGKAARRVFRVM